MITSKEQERKALAQIRKIVESLGEDSYIATAFEGCFDIAEDNIENDFALSMKGKCEYIEKEREAAVEKAMDLESRAYGLESINKDLNQAIANLKEENEALKAKLREADERSLKNYNNWVSAYNEAEGRAQAVEAENEDLKTEVVTLKAKLYDLMFAE